MAATSMKKRSPRRYLLHPKFQLGIIFKVVVVAILNIVFMWIAVSHTFAHFEEQGIKMNFPAGSFYFSILEHERASMIDGMLIMGVLNLLILLIGGIVMTHRIVGPLYRMREHMLEVGEAKSDKNLNFRKKDYFQDLPAAFNKVAERIRKKS